MKTTAWDLGPDPILHANGNKPTGGTDTIERPTADAPTVEPTEAPAPKPTKTKSRANPVAHWYGDMKADIAARKRRSDGRWWLMRWMGEQPTSVRDYLDFLLHHRHERPGGRKGWGLRTEAALIDGPHAFLYRLYGLAVGLPLTLLAYAFGWIAQRPGRFLLLVLAIVFACWNLSTWLAGS
jgi:hypothetical protein